MNHEPTHVLAFEGLDRQMNHVGEFRVGEMGLKQKVVGPAKRDQPGLNGEPALFDGRGVSQAL